MLAEHLQLNFILQHHHHHPQPYKFGYDIKDHHGSQHRHEHGDGHGHVQGSYGFTDHRGIHREVHYVADHHGFRAKVNTNEPELPTKILLMFTFTPMLTMLFITMDIMDTIIMITSSPWPPPPRTCPCVSPSSSSWSSLWFLKFLSSYTA
ncbi:hypothetical protein CEXT_345581 [Caerostris extrusa]|uniref:Uncharacterized protein n=1 Tax=Caerostris extrusa TaxID=172846 RepID=A0AAV4S7P5_CAEEX|nr:hypothetical protein CEXT_345581 [Caerostris extrusa]